MSKEALLRPDGKSERYHALAQPDYIAILARPPGAHPMARVVEGFRWALLGKAAGPGPLLLVSVLAVIALLVGGLYYLRRLEKMLADVV